MAHTHTQANTKKIANFADFHDLHTHAMTYCILTWSMNLISANEYRANGKKWENILNEYLSHYHSSNSCCTLAVYHFVYICAEDCDEIGLLTPPTYVCMWIIQKYYPVSWISCVLYVSVRVLYISVGVEEE